MNTVFILSILAIISIAGYFSFSVTTWSIVTTLYLLFVQHVFIVNNILFNITATIIGCIIAIGHVPFLKELVVLPLYKIAKRILPKVSTTEKLALDAGDTWYEKELFQGSPNFELLHRLKKFELNQEEQSFLEHEVEELCSLVDDWQITYKEHDLPKVAWDFIRQHKLFGLVIDREYDGKGFSAAAHSAIVMKIASKSLSLAVTVMVPNSLGPGELIYHYGTAEQKRKYLPRLARAEDIPCFALTGVTAGSDATSITDQGVVCYGEHDGQTVLGVKLYNINKRYITLAPIATLVGLAFVLHDPDNLLQGIGSEGITCALLPHDHPGLEIGNRLYPLYQAFMNGTIRIQDAFIPIDWIIGGQKMAGEGWRMLVECLSIGRSISLPACGVATSLVATLTSSAYSIIREQFRQPLALFGGIEAVLAKTCGIAYLANATRQFTVAAVDSGMKPSVASAIAKYHLTELGRKSINIAMDIHAGRGIIVGPNNYLANAYQATPISITVEGANILTRNLIIFGQGAMRCHPYLRTEYESLAGSDGLSVFAEAVFGHFGYFLKNKVHAIFHAFTFGFFANGRYQSKFNIYYKQITRLSSTFAYLSDVILILLGAKIKRLERISARLGDVMSYLYMAIATLKYYEDNGSHTADEIFVLWSVRYCLFKAQTAIYDTLDNLKYLGKLLKLFLFPYGRPFKAPADSLEHDIVHSIVSNSSVRETFKHMCYVPNNNNDPIGRMENAFLAVLDTKDIYDKIIDAVKRHAFIGDSDMNKNAAMACDLGIITQSELERFLNARSLVSQVVQVDEFLASELGVKHAFEV